MAQKQLEGKKEKKKKKKRFSQITEEDASYPNGPLERDRKMRGEVTG